MTVPVAQGRRIIIIIQRPRRWLYYHHQDMVGHAPVGYLVKES